MRTRFFVYVKELLRAHNTYTDTSAHAIFQALYIQKTNKSWWDSFEKCRKMRRFTQHVWLLVYLYETLPESNTGHLWIIMTHIECFLRRAKISFADYEGMLFYLNIFNKDRLLFFTRFITSKAIKLARLETKTIISEFNS